MLEGTQCRHQTHEITPMRTNWQRNTHTKKTLLSTMQLSFVFVWKWWVSHVLQLSGPERDSVVCFLYLCQLCVCALPTELQRHLEICIVNYTVSSLLTVNQEGSCLRVILCLIYWAINNRHLGVYSGKCFNLFQN